MLGGLFFIVGYAILWSFGFEFMVGFDLMVIPLCFVLLVFVLVIVWYWLYDVEVIVKCSVVYTVVVVVMVVIYFVLEVFASEVFFEESD